jgi:tetratricopeptide (TPR) repeat protein
MLSLWEGNTTLAGRNFQLVATSGGLAATQLAAAGFTVLVTQPQDTSQIQGELGHAFLAADIPALAVVPFERAVSLAPRSGVAHAYLGWTLLQLDQPLRAKPEVARGVSLSPSVGFVWFAAGEVELALGQPALALTDFQEGETLDPGNPLLFAEAGQAALLLRNYTAAERFLETASSLSSTPTEAIALLSIYVDFHLGMGDGTARAAGIRAVTRWPRSEALQFLLAQILADSDQLVDAYYATLTAHRLDPTDPGPYVLLGAQAESEGDYITAALDLRIALALRPSGPLAPEARTLLAPIANVST